MLKSFSLINFTLHQVDKIAIVSLCNVAKKNALSFQLLKELKIFVTSLDLQACRVVILDSKCDNVFSSGHDLRELDSCPEQVPEIIKTCSEIMLSIIKSQTVFIAEVDGLATAAGFQLASSCDLIVASDRSTFAIPGSNIGLYAATPAIPLILSLPNKVAFDLVVSGSVYSARDMLKYGIVNKVVNLEDETCTNDMKKYKLRQQTLALANKITSQEEVINNIKLIKQTLYSKH